MLVRPERVADWAAIRSVNLAAFGGVEEADLVDRLREEGAVLRSLVAYVNRQVVGHVLFSRMWIDTVEAVSLAPLAVLPGHQRQGIGGRLVRRGLDELRELGERIVIVLGHPGYYPQFGFSCELASAIESPFRREAFMALELQPGSLAGVRGRVRYAKAFGLVTSPTEAARPDR